MSFLKKVIKTFSIVLFLSSLGICQFDDPAQAAYYEALDLIKLRGQIAPGIELLNQVAQDFPESPWGTSARLQVGHYTSDLQEAIAIYGQIANDFPGTRTEAVARLSILERQLPDDLEAWLDGVGLIAEGFDSPPIDDILEERGARENAMLVRGLPEEKQEALGAIYSAIWSKIALKNQQKERALPIALFTRTALEPVGIDDGNLLNIQLSLQELQLDPPWITPGLESNPTVLVQIPADGSIVGIEPEISATITVGDYRHVQADLGSTEILLDGNDIKPLTEFRSDVNRVLDEDAIFETINLSVAPGPLAPGPHTLTITVPIAGYREGEGITTVTSNFLVSNAPPTPLSIDATQDSILSLLNQHENDGANVLLTLEKIQGKATRSAVAFELSNINLNGLSSATLVLTIDPGEHVNGWGNGRTISAQALSSPWLEGNGKSFGLKNKDQVPGNGAGATWFSPSDEDISNDSANSTVNWNGAAYSAAPPTAPSVVISNGLSGEVAFDVTADVLNGAEHGWLILKDQENVGSMVSYYSREGAAAAGNPDLAPRLLLEFGQVASNSSEAQSKTLLSRIGFGAIDTKLRPISGSEVRSVKQILQENKVAALAVEQLVSQEALTNPVANWTTRLAYRSWVSESIQIAANLEMTRS